MEFVYNHAVKVMLQIIKQDIVINVLYAKLVKYQKQDAFHAQMDYF